MVENSTELSLSSPKTEGTENSDIRTVTIINRTEDVEKRAEKLAKDQFRDEKGKLGFSPKHLLRRGLMWAGEEFYKYRGIKRARKAMLKHNNAFVDVDVMHDKVQDPKAHIMDEREAAKAKIEQVALPDQIKEDGFQVVEKAEGRLKQMLVSEVLRPVVDGKISTEADMQKSLRSFMQSHDQDEDPQVREQIKKLFGSEATQHHKKAEYFATDMMDMGNAIKEDIDAHEYAIDQIDEKVQIKLANTDWAADTKSKLTIAEKAASGIMRRPWAKAALNEVTVGAIAGVASFSINRAAPIPFYIVGGIGAGDAVVGYMEQNKKLKEVMSLRRADIEYGKEGSDGSKQQEKLDRYQYQEQASIPELLDKDDERSTLGDDSRSLNTLLEADISVDNVQDKEALVRRIAEIQERLRFSSREGAGMIRYEGETKVEQGRLELIKGIVEGKKKVIDALIAQGMQKPQAEAQLHKDIQRDVDLWDQRFMKDKKDQDRAFAIYRYKSSAARGAMSGVLGIGGFYGSQEALKAAAHLV